MPGSSSPPASSLARARKPVTDRTLRAAKPEAKPYKLFCGGGDGLYLYVSVAGGKVFRLGYRGPHGARVYTMRPAYPELSLAAARAEAIRVKALLRQGIDPIAAERARKAAAERARRNSFGALSQEWFAAHEASWAPSYARRIRRLLDTAILPAFGSRPIREISALDMRELMHAVSAGAPTMAVRCRVVCGGVFQHALALGLIEGDPAHMARRTLARPVSRPQPAALRIQDARAVLIAVEATSGSLPAKLAHRLLALTVVRPGELAGARWEEFDDLDGAAPLWRIPAERMKGKGQHHRLHVVPLSPAAIAVLRIARQLSGPEGAVFPAVGGKWASMHPDRLTALLRNTRLPVPHVPHGWRASFSTLMNERCPDEHDAIEASLAHVIAGVRGTYNRATYLDRRRVLMAAWAELLLAGVPALALEPGAVAA